MSLPSLLKDTSPELSRLLLNSIRPSSLSILEFSMRLESGTSRLSDNRARRELMLPWSLSISERISSWFLFSALANSRLKQSLLESGIPFLFGLASLPPIVLKEFTNKEIYKRSGQVYLTHLIGFEIIIFTQKLTCLSWSLTERNP